MKFHMHHRLAGERAAAFNRLLPLTGAVEYAADTPVTSWAIRIDVCCSVMRQMLDDSLVTTGETFGANPNRFGKVYLKVKVLDWPDFEGSDYAEYEAHYCSFCGERIEYVVVGKDRYMESGHLGVYDTEELCV